MEAFFTSLIPYYKLFLLGGILALFVLVFYWIIILALFMREFLTGEKQKTLEELAKDLKSQDPFERKKAMRKCVAPDGVNPNPYNFLVINDGGKDIYTRSFTVVAMPNEIEFFYTFERLFNFGNAKSSVFIDKIPQKDAEKKFDRHSNVLSAEMETANKQGNDNRVRKLQGQIHDNEAWAKMIERNKKTLYHVGFLFTLRAESIEELNFMSDAFFRLANDRGVVISACYGVQKEAYLSNMPYGLRYGLSLGRTDKRSVLRLAQSDALKTFTFDTESLSAIFNYTKNSFSHKGGAYLGRNMGDRSTAYWDAFDDSHGFGYNIVVGGKTGCGKSTFIKVLILRSDDVCFACVDSQRSSKSSTEGEYVPIARSLNGNVYTIDSTYKNTLNIFEVSTSKVVEVDDFGALKEEYETLDLNEKISAVTNVIMLLILYDEASQKLSDISLSEKSYMVKCIDEFSKELYAQCGIYHGNPASLYDTLENGRRVKKTQPTLKDLYKKLLLRMKTEVDSSNQINLRTMLNALSPYVRELYYTDSLRFIDRGEYEELLEKGEVVHAVLGSKAFFDGESTFEMDTNAKLSVVDISGVSSSLMMLAQIIAIDFLNENYVKKNNADPRKAKKLMLTFDEAGILFKNEYARGLVERLVRTARKLNVGNLIAFQQITDAGNYEETEAIMKNVAGYFLFKHEETSKDYVLKHTKITEGQFASVCELGGGLDENGKARRKGEVCLIENDMAHFIKIDVMPSERLLIESNVNEIAGMLNG